VWAKAVIGLFIVQRHFFIQYKTTDASANNEYEQRQIVYQIDIVALRS